MRLGSESKLVAVSPTAPWFFVAQAAPTPPPFDAPAVPLCPSCSCGYSALALVKPKRLVHTQLRVLSLRLKEPQVQAAVHYYSLHQNAAPPTELVLARQVNHSAMAFCVSLPPLRRAREHQDPGAVREPKRIWRANCDRALWCAAACVCALRPSPSFGTAFSGSKSSPLSGTSRARTTNDDET